MQNVEGELQISLRDAYEGSDEVINVDGKRLSMRVPAGTRDGARLRLAIARWSSGTAITVSVLLAVLGLLPVMLTRSAGTWSWLAASACAVAVLSLTLAWAAVRTRSLWMPLGWAAGLAGTGAAVLQGWPAQALGAWAAAGAAAAAGLLLIPAVLVLERVRPSGSERRAA